MGKKVVIRQVGPTATNDDLMQLWHFCQKLPTSPTNGFEWPEVLVQATDFTQFRKGLQELRQKEELNLDLIRERGYVPQYYWWGYNETGQLIGVAKIRPILTPVMWYNGGHVGLGIAEAFRGKGYGTLFMEQIIKQCRNYGMTDILVTIDANNLASRRVAEKSGGQMLGVIGRDGKDIVRYLISC